MHRRRARHATACCLLGSLCRLVLHRRILLWASDMPTPPQSMTPPPPRGEGAQEPPFVYQSAVQDGQLHAVNVLASGSGYVCGGDAKFELDIGGSSWHLGAFACGDSGAIAKVTLLKQAPTVYPGDQALESAFKYPRSCNGKTRDTSRCASKSQHTSISSMRIMSSGSNYVSGEVRQTRGAVGRGFSAVLKVDEAGGIVDYEFANAEAHGAGYDANTQVDVFYPGTNIKMTGSVTSVDVLEGGSGHKAGALVVKCEGACVGTGLAGVCQVDAIGAVTQVVVTSHGQGYNRDEPPTLWCGYGSSSPLMVPNVASGAQIEVN